MDKEERSHGVRQSQLPQDAHDSSSMLSTMLKYGGGRATLYYDLRASRRTVILPQLSLFLNAYTYMPSTIDATFVYLSL